MNPMNPYLDDTATVPRGKVRKTDSPQEDIERLRHMIPAVLWEYGTPKYLNRGSSGVIFRVGYYFAVKVIDCGSDPVKREAAGRELAIMQKLKGISGVILPEDSTVFEADGSLYVIILERYHTPLTEIIEKNTFTASDTVKLGTALCGITEQLADAGIFHLDIQPKNIFTDPDGSCLLGDFGSAIEMTELMHDDGWLRGTRAYMAPEVCHFRRYSVRSEIYSIAMLLYSLLNRGALPLTDGYEPKEAVERRLAGDDIPPLKDCPAALNAVLLRALSYDPKLRFDSFAAFAEALNSDMSSLSAITEEFEPETEEIPEDTEPETEPVPPEIPDDDLSPEAEEMTETAESITEPITAEIPNDDIAPEPEPEEIPEDTEPVTEPITVEIPDDNLSPEAEEIPEATEPDAESELPQIPENDIEPEPEEIPEPTEPNAELLPPEVPENDAEPVPEEIPEPAELITEPITAEIPEDEAEPEAEEMSEAAEPDMEPLQPEIPEDDFSPEPEEKPEAPEPEPEPVLTQIPKDDIEPEPEELSEANEPDTEPASPEISKTPKPEPEPVQPKIPDDNPAPEPEPGPVQKEKSVPARSRLFDRISNLGGVFGGRNKKTAAGPAPAAARVNVLRPDEVQFSAFFPDQFLKGESSLLEIIMYEEKYRQIVNKAIAAGETVLSAENSGILPADENPAITVHLECRDKSVQILGNDERQIWTGKYQTFGFSVLQDTDNPSKQLMFTAMVYINDVIAVYLRFIVKCDTMYQQRMRVMRDDVTSAFISCSGEDRDRGEAAIRRIRTARPDLDIFFDPDSILTDEYWENVLSAEIGKRDILFLCWSPAAARSDRVSREWRYALETKGVDSIEPIAIDRSDDCPLPEELASKQFIDRIS